jgi:hypothetical protein
MATLTPELKAKIDSKSYQDLLYDWRFTPVGDTTFQGESGEYFSKRMAELRSAPGGNEKHVSASKKIGWGE